MPGKVKIVRLRQRYGATVFALHSLRVKTGGKGIRTPDFQLAKLALYHLSYAPQGKSKIEDGRWKIGDCNSG